MKSVIFTICALFLIRCCPAQYFPDGTGYRQSFDTLHLGMPMGWGADTNATGSRKGGSAALVASPGTTTRWNNASAGFKNLASANSFASFAAATAALQLAATDRALGLRQTGTFGDPGAAFSFVVDNTFRLRDLRMELKLQSLDSGAGRSTSWQLQYGLGRVPDTFITVATGLLSTGGNTYTNKVISAAFGAALDDQRQPVHFRLVTLVASTGAGSRGTTAIDDVYLFWTGAATSGYRPLAAGYEPVPGSRDVLHGSSLSIRFNRQVHAGTGGNFYIRNETDGSLQTFPAAAATAAGDRLDLAGVKLHPGHSYYVTYDSTIADTAGLYTYALEDTTAWRFRVSPSIPALTAEYFDSACGKGGLPVSWYRFSSSGAATWNCMTYSGSNAAIGIYGGRDGAGFESNEDWLITPLLDLSSPDASGISFSMYKSGRGAEPSILFSQDYAGSGHPDSAAWTSLSFSSAASDTGSWRYHMLPLSVSERGKPLHLAFRYTSDTGSGYMLRVDSFRTMTRTGLPERSNSAYGFRILGHTGAGLHLEINSPAGGDYTLQVFNSIGQLQQQQKVYLQGGLQYLAPGFLLPVPGLYIVCLRSPQYLWRQAWQSY